MSKKKIGEFFLMFFVQVIYYGIICINMRAIAQGHYSLAVFTDFIIATISYFVIKRISSADETLHHWFGFALGGAVGSIWGIWLSKLITNI